MSPRILVPIDFGLPCDALLRTAAKFWRRCEARPTLLHVSEPQRSDEGRAGPHHTMALLEAARQQLRQHADIPVDLAMTQGRPAREIVRFAQERAFDLIILGDRRPIGSSGSAPLTERVSRGAPCPVLTVRHAPRSVLRPAHAVAIHAS